MQPQLVKMKGRRMCGALQHPLRVLAQLFSPFGYDYVKMLHEDTLVFKTLSDWIENQNSNRL